MFKFLRILILTFILVNVALSAWLTRERTTDWNEPLAVVVHVLNGDGSTASQDYIETLKAMDRETLDAHFADIEAFFSREAERHGLSLGTPVDVTFAGQIESLPPLPPSQGSAFSIGLWSLKLRYWASRNNDYPYHQDVQMYVQYFDPKRHPALAHSLGLQKGMIGVVNAFASKAMKAQNHVVVAHELLHTVGATDKYDPATNQPLFPDGYADPDQEPRYPQKRAEIMAGRMATSEDSFDAPRKLAQVV
ncbi:MAG: hypothetical protein AB7I01_22865, partial [Gammaproteobacteria bacterium]